MRALMALTPDDFYARERAHDQLAVLRSARGRDERIGAIRALLGLAPAGVYRTA